VEAIIAATLREQWLVKEAPPLAPVVEAIDAVLRRLGREYDISPALVGEAAVYDHINLTDEMASRFALAPVPRWSYGEELSRPSRQS
jgi:hypothetical protein